MGYFRAKVTEIILCRLAEKTLSGYLRCSPSAVRMELSEAFGDTWRRAQSGAVEPPAIRRRLGPAYQLQALFVVGACTPHWIWSCGRCTRLVAEPFSVCFPESREPRDSADGLWVREWFLSVSCRSTRLTMHFRYGRAPLLMRRASIRLTVIVESAHRMITLRQSRH